MQDHSIPSHTGNPIISSILGFVSIVLNLSHMKLAEIDAEILAPVGRIIAIIVGILSIDGFLFDHIIAKGIKKLLGLINMKLRK